MANEINLTPNYEFIFKASINDARNQVQAFPLALVSAQFDEYPETAEDIRARAAVLRAIQGFLAPLTIALQCATSVVDIEAVRGVAADLLQRVDKDAGQFEAEADEIEEVDRESSTEGAPNGD